MRTIVGVPLPNLQMDFARVVWDDSNDKLIGLLALGGAVPWRSLLLVYGLATLIGSLGLTPGGRPSTAPMRLMTSCRAL